MSEIFIPMKVPGADVTAELKNDINNIGNDLNTLLTDLVAKVNNDIPYISLNDANNFSNGLKIVGVSKDVEGSPIASSYGICYVLRTDTAIYQLCMAHNNQLFWRTWWVSNTAPEWNQVEKYLHKKNYATVKSIAELDNYTDTEGTVYLELGGQYAFVKIEIFERHTSKVVIQTRYNMLNATTLTRRSYQNAARELLWTTWV